MSQSPIALRLNAISVSMEDTPHPEIVLALKIGAEEVQRLWELAEKRYYTCQMLESSNENMERSLRWALTDFCPACRRGHRQSYPSTCESLFHRWQEGAWIEIGPTQSDDPTASQTEVSP